MLLLQRAMGFYARCNIFVFLYYISLAASYSQIKVDPYIWNISGTHSNLF